MTEDEIKKQKERQAHGLQSLCERADMVLEGNRQLLQKRRTENCMARWRGSGPASQSAQDTYFGGEKDRASSSSQKVSDAA